MFTFRILVLFLCLMTALAGCKGNPGQGGGPPSPLEAQILTSGVMAVALSGEKYDATKLQKLHDILRSAHNTVNLALSNDPSSLETVNLEFIEGLDPLYRDIVSSFMQVLILRVKPYIDTENPDLQLAKSYVDAIFAGAIQAVVIAQKRQAFYSEDPSKGLRS